MKCKSACLTLLILSCLASFVKAQNPDTIKTPYLFNDFRPGTVKLKSGELKNTLLNYNMVTEEMIFKNSNQLLALDQLESIDTVDISGKKFIPSGKIFYEEAVHSTISLYIEHKANAIPPAQESAFGGTSQTTSAKSFGSMDKSLGYYALKLPDQYTLQNETKYFIKRNTTFYEIASFKQLQKLFKQKNQQIEQYVKSSNLNFKTISDLKMVIVFINSLI